MWRTTYAKLEGWDVKIPSKCQNHASEPLLKAKACKEKVKKLDVS